MSYFLGFFDFVGLAFGWFIVCASLVLLFLPGAALRRRVPNLLFGGVCVYGNWADISYGSLAGCLELFFHGIGQPAKPPAKLSGGQAFHFHISHIGYYGGFLEKILVVGNLLNKYYPKTIKKIKISRKWDIFS
jgi:hypothetical protein